MVKRNTGHGQHNYHTGAKERHTRHVMVFKLGIDQLDEIYKLSTGLASTHEKGQHRRDAPSAMYPYSPPSHPSLSCTQATTPYARFPTPPYRLRFPRPRLHSLRPCRRPCPGDGCDSVHHSHIYHRRTRHWRTRSGASKHHLRGRTGGESSSNRGQCRWL